MKRVIMEVLVTLPLTDARDYIVDVVPPLLP
jgi:hypothetical protein